MFLDSKKAEGRLKNPSNILNTLGLETGDNSSVVLHRPLHNGGRRSGSKNIPIELQTLIGTVAKFDTVKETAEAFGISVHHAQELKHGMTSYYTTAEKAGKDEELVKRIDANVMGIRDQALVKTLEFIGLLDKNKVKDEKPTDIARIARDMATIAEKVGPKDAGVNIGKVVFYGPSVRSLDKFEVIDVEPVTK
jgi:hypothetical protein